MGEPIDPNPQPVYYGRPPAAGATARPHARRDALIAAAIGVALVAGGVLGWYFSSSSSSPSSSSPFAFSVSGSSTQHVVVPSTFDGYSRLTNSTAQQVEANMRSLGDTAGGGAAKKIFDAASIAVYAKNSGDQPVLVALVVPTASTADGASAEQISAGLLQGAVSDSRKYPSGSHGGVTRCGSAQFGVAAETICAWSDHHTSGLVVSVNPPAPPAGLATVSVSFRDHLG